MAYEFEGELELEDEFEGELEDEFEGELEDEFEGEMEGEMEDELEGEGWLGALGNIAGSLLGESEDEYEGEGEFEGEEEDEEELSPIRKIYPDAMMEHLGELAAEAESEEEAAEHFLPLIGMAASKLLPVVARAVAPMAKKMVPKIARAVTRSTPHLTKGIAKVAKALHRNPQTRHLLRAVPGIARRTVGHIAHKVARGGHVSPRAAVHTLVRQARHVLGTPGHRAQALRRHSRLERGFHGRVGRGIVHPHMRHGRRWRYGRYPGWHRGRRIAGAVRPGHMVPHAVRPMVRQGGVPAIHHAAGTVVTPGVHGTVRYGRTVGGQCVCPACSTPGVATTTAAPAPAYCRCCGQVLR